MSALQIPSTGSLGWKLLYEVFRLRKTLQSEAAKTDRRNADKGQEEIEMSKETNLMGLNLSVDNELIASAAREAIVASVAESLEMKDQLVREFVKSVLTERVRIEDGKPSQYHGDKCCSRMEWYVRKAISEATKEEIINMIDEQKPVIAEMVRKELMSKKTQSRFVEMFMDTLAGTFKSQYTAKVNVEFTQDKDY